MAGHNKKFFFLNRIQRRVGYSCERQSSVIVGIRRPCECEQHDLLRAERKGHTGGN